MNSKYLINKTKVISLLLCSFGINFGTSQTIIDSCFLSVEFPKGKEFPEFRNNSSKNITLSNSVLALWNEKKWIIDERQNIPGIIALSHLNCKRAIILGTYDDKKYNDISYVAFRLDKKLKNGSYYFISLFYQHAMFKEPFKPIIYSNKKPNLKKAYMVEELPPVYDKQCRKERKTYNATRKQNGHKWIIINVGESGCHGILLSQCSCDEDTSMQLISLSKETDLLSQTKQIYSDTINFNQEKIILKNVEFESGQSILLPKSEPELEQLLVYLQNNSSVKIEISGHTDIIGNSKQNLQLSEDRAKAVADYLINNGISGERISYVGYGDKFPIGDNLTDEGRRMNRRVEVKILIGQMKK